MLRLVMMAGVVSGISSADFMVGISYWGHLRCNGARYRHAVLTTAYCASRPRDGLRIHSGHLLMGSTQAAKVARIERNHGLAVIHPETQLGSSPLALDRPTPLRIGTELVLFGWGRNPRTGARRQWLGQLNTTVADLARCCDMLAIDITTEFCAGQEAPMHRCRMDLGSALVSPDRRVLVGLMSQAGGCQASPAVFVRVADHQPWIDTDGLYPHTTPTKPSASDYYE